MREQPADAEKTSFSKYVTRRKRAAYGGEEGARYAYGADLAMLATFKRIKPVEMAAAATVRMYKDVFRNQLLGTTIKVTPRQFPSIYKIAEECAEALSVPVPTLYITNDPRLNAFTFGTDDDAMIVIHSALVDHYERDELKFVIGHETGHIQNKHVVYNTVLQLMHQTIGLLLRWIVPPAEVALNTWYRRAEITCDRAGLLCCGDEDAAGRALLKLACGSKKLYAELDVDEYMNQLEEGREGVGRFAELFASHPYLTKRIQALRVFGESEMYRQAAGVGEGGLSIDEVDRRTSEIIQIVKGHKNEHGEEGSRGD
jgi:Zn-dependent protease with chaperone function